MRRLLAILFVLLMCGCTFVEQGGETQPEGLCIVGASFAYPENGWFEMACEQLNCTPINKAISGECIIHTAQRFSDNTQFAEGELDKFRIFVIMHTHNVDVCNGIRAKKDRLGENPTIAEAYDYVIRRYISMCRELEFDSSSAWFGVAGGKPVDIILCTHWHDGRVIFNNSVRRLSEQWRGYVRLCEFDKNIGFTKDRPITKSGKQVSTSYAHPGAGATEIIDGVEYGWHPKRGRDSEIQQRMADIFCKCF